MLSWFKVKVMLATDRQRDIISLSKYELYTLLDLKSRIFVNYLK